MCQACDEGQMALCSGVLSLLKEICQRRRYYVLDSSAWGQLKIN